MKQYVHICVQNPKPKRKDVFFFDGSYTRAYIGMSLFVWSMMMFFLLLVRYISFTRIDIYIEIWMFFNVLFNFNQKTWMIWSFSFSDLRLIIKRKPNLRKSLRIESTWIYVHSTLKYVRWELKCSMSIFEFALIVIAKLDGSICWFIFQTFDVSVCPPLFFPPLGKASIKCSSRFIGAFKRDNDWNDFSVG